MSAPEIHCYQYRYVERCLDALFEQSPGTVPARPGEPPGSA